MKGKIVKIALAALTMGSIFQIPIDNAYAETKKSVWIKYGEINKEMIWENPKIVSYPNKEYGDYPRTISYDQDGFTGTLYAKRIKLIPKEKNHHKEPIYVTQTKEFNKSVSKTYNLKDNSLIPNKLLIDEDGFKGEISLVGDVSWQTNWEKNRQVTLSKEWVDSIFRRYDWQSPAPSTIRETYYDQKSGQTLNFDIGQSGSKYITESKDIWIESRSEGRAEYYDGVGNTRLGFMSYNPWTYYGDMYNFSDYKPLKPDTYYGIEPDKENWIVQDYGWDESEVADAEDPKWHYKTAAFGYRWKSESGRLNRYRKGVWIDYIKKVQGHKFAQRYQQTVNLPDIEKDYTGVANYKGKLSKQVLDHWKEYDTSSKWDVEVEYDGDINGTNLKAESIEILDMDKKGVSHLIKNKEYQAKIIFMNDGELDVGAFNLSVYQNENKLQDIKIKGIQKGKRITEYVKFIATDTGDRNFKAIVDSENVIKETNEEDNEVSIIKHGNTPPIAEIKINPEKIFEGDNVNVTIIPKDEDKDKLKVTLTQKVNGKWKEVLLKNDVETETKIDYAISAIPLGVYEYKLTVSDPWDSTSYDFKIVPKKLEITGHVLHTPDWESKHKLLGNKMNQFYSGEVFVLKADITDYETNYVKVNFKGKQQNGRTFEKNINLKKENNVLYIGELFDEQFFDNNTQLAKGTVNFKFSVQYINGQIREQEIPIDIIGNAYNAFKYHRAF